MQKDIQDHILLIEQANKWAEKYEQDSFPTEQLKQIRRRLKKIASSLSENCSSAAYGESQVGKSYLMNALLSAPDKPFVITSGGKDYNFIDELNPSGGNLAQIESTGIVTRFTLRQDNLAKERNLLKIRNLSVVDIIMLIADSYYNDLKIDVSKSLSAEDINIELEKLNHLWANKSVSYDYILDDDIKDIQEYIQEVIGNNAVNFTKSKFATLIAQEIPYISYEKWADVFSLIWNKNEEMTKLFNTLISEYKKLNFQEHIYVPFDAVLRIKGTLLKIEWLDSVCGKEIDLGRDEPFTDVYDKDGNLLAQNFSKGSLSALIAELCFNLPEEVGQDHPFLRKIDLLDFPGARSREKYREAEIATVLPKVLRRGKVVYLFNKYSRALHISSVLFCHHHNQKAEATIGDAINTWIQENIGRTPKDRTEYLKKTSGIAPIFMIATKFNIDLTRTVMDKPEYADRLSDHWSRFDTVIPEIIKPNTWFDEWTDQPPYSFQNVYPLRDFYWSSKNKLFQGSGDDQAKIYQETDIYHHEDYPNYFEQLRESFLKHRFVKQHFANPQATWDSVATINNDGSKAIIDSLNAIAETLATARDNKYAIDLKALRQETESLLLPYFESEDSAERNARLRQVVNKLKLNFTMAISKQPEIFGKVVNELVISTEELRDIAYKIIVCHSETPTSKSQEVSSFRAICGFTPGDSREDKISKLEAFFGEKLEMLQNSLTDQGLDLDEVLSNNEELTSTLEGLVAERIVEYWIKHLNAQIPLLDSAFQQGSEVIAMLLRFERKEGLRYKIKEKIASYLHTFDKENAPNVIGDYCSLILNNFVNNIGIEYLSKELLSEIEQKAATCNICIETAELKEAPKEEVLSLRERLSMFALQDKNPNSELPIWANFRRWENLVRIGMLHTNDVSNCNPQANEAMKELLDSNQALYK